MRKIHTLSPSVIAKIAAGEVIEKPSFAVKELVENAIDAKATAITIIIEESGLKKITIIDNGEGMSKQDIIECFKPHTTSKISSDDSLIGISSLGFRGEALATIAGISNMTIKSRTANDATGNEVTLIAGEIAQSNQHGMPTGTTIEITNLFYTVPARKKFLKSKQSEFRQIIDVVINAAIAYPHIRFTFSHNNKLLFDVFGTKNQQERISKVLGKDFILHTFKIKFKDSYMRLHGYLGFPQFASATQKQYLFINKRPVHDKQISQAIKEAYGQLLDTTSYPLYVLFMEVPFETVDVNVHPRKEQISFIDSNIFQQVNQAIKSSLAGKNITFKDTMLQQRMDRSGNTTSIAGKLLKELMLQKSHGTHGYISQLSKVYIILQTHEGISIFDQHAAHERVMYESFMETFKQQKNKKEITFPVKTQALDLSFTDAALLQEYLPLLFSLGFTIEQFKDTTYLITHVPTMFVDRNIEELIREILSDIKETNTLKSIDKKSQRMLAYLACRAAIKAGDTLNEKQMKHLIEILERTPNNATCPHGRPTKILFSIRGLHKMFKRS